ncbi:putative glutamine amidotransferase [Aeromicrobium panaciterrae]|uniref:Glutamine amidotransferase n=2 Tax=Aeromicrobium panaciterrae TaxID=363861 RepID=A0ABU1UQY9_9ACTN|nr:putative glutamine amidotransferase [Aeromicrobium panaciterrae]
MRPLLVPGEHAIDLLDVVDALVLTGGGDLDAELSGVIPDETHDIDRARDNAEISLVLAAAEQGVPILGCCRGLQVLAVAFGGTLRTVDDHIQPGPGHEVSTQPGSLIADLIGPAATTTALHAQAIDDPSSYWQPTAWSDGTIEAIEPASSDWPALGVQWHPELSGVGGFNDDTGTALFSWLAGQAALRQWSPAQAMRWAT